MTPVDLPSGRQTSYAVLVTSADLPNELDVLRDVSRRLESAGIDFMITGSMAVNYYAVPRMTRDIDVIVDIQAADAGRLVTLFEDDYFVSRTAIDEAVRHCSSFNLIHREGLVKVDCFPRKGSAFHVEEFGRRRRVQLGEFSTFLATPEDLVLSKLLWAQESRSETQLRDVQNLAGNELDEVYLRHWAAQLGVTELLDELTR